jgi:hypothetical protein
MLSGVMSVAACKKEADSLHFTKPHTDPPIRIFRVYEPQTDNLLMEFDDRPGILVGPGCKPPAGTDLKGEPHPFLNATFRGSSTKERIYPVLAKSKSVDDFLLRLRVEGFRLEQTVGPRVPWWHVRDPKSGALLMAFDDRRGDVAAEGCAQQTDADANSFLDARFAWWGARSLCPVLAKSANTRDFVRLLKEAGYVVERADDGKSGMR